MINTDFSSLSFFLGSIIFVKIKLYLSNQKPNESIKTHILFKEKEKFIDLFTQLSTINQYNRNIHPDFYHFETFVEMKETTHPEEEQWKTRVLFQHTPQGNIIMFYDTFRNAFSYYSDFSIPYSLLNLCAMKYVRTFRCLDFFCDTNELPPHVMPPLVRFKEQELKEELDKKNEKRKQMNITFDATAFVSSKKQNKTTDPSKTESEKNHFCYLGKLTQFAFLKRPTTTKVSFRKPIQYSYQDFKRMKEVHS